LDTVSPVLLHLVHGEIRGTKEVCGAPAVRRKDGQSHAACHLQIDAIKRDRLGDGVPDPLNGGKEFTPVALKHKNEFVPTDTGDTIILIDEGRNPICRHLDEPVTGMVAQGVIDLLEIVQIQEADGNFSTGPLGLRKNIGKPAFDKTPVWQTGQDIVFGEIIDLLLGQTAIDGDAHHAD